MELTEQDKTHITITRHITIVKSLLLRLAHRLEERSIVHDLSKFSEDEFGGFVKINKIARTKEYGSEEYMKSIISDTVGLHILRNTHHPEHYENGVYDMSLLDIIEMVIDWKAASETYGQTSFEDSLNIQAERFDLSDEQIYLVKLIADELTP